MKSVPAKPSLLPCDGSSRMKILGAESQGSSEKKKRSRRVRALLPVARRGSNSKSPYELGTIAHILTQIHMQPGKDRPLRRRGPRQGSGPQATSYLLYCRVLIEAFDDTGRHSESRIVLRGEP